MINKIFIAYDTQPEIIKISPVLILVLENRNFPYNTIFRDQYRDLYESVKKILPPPYCSRENPYGNVGESKKIIDSITQEIVRTNNVKLLDVDMGYDTNRTVVTFAGPPNRVIEVAFNVIKKAAAGTARSFTAKPESMRAMRMFNFISSLFADS